MTLKNYMTALHQSTTYKELAENLEAEEVEVFEIWEVVR